MSSYKSGTIDESKHRWYFCQNRSTSTGAWRDLVCRIAYKRGNIENLINVPINYTSVYLRISVSAKFLKNNKDYFLNVIFNFVYAHF